MNKKEKSGTSPVGIVAWKKKRVGALLGGIAAAGVLVWVLAFIVFPTGTPPPPNGNHNSTNNSTNNSTGSTYAVELTGKSSLETGRIKIGSHTKPYVIGATVISAIQVSNGENTTVNYVITCRQPDNPTGGYIKAPASACEWFQIADKQLMLPAGRGKDIGISMKIPADTPESKFIVHYLTEAGELYLTIARDSTVSSEDAMAAAFKEELANFTDIYAQFDELYTSRGDSYVFKAIYDAFPTYYPELVGAWERARVDVAADLVNIPYATGLATLERLGTISEANMGDYPELSGLPEEYMATADLRVQPWEVWITVTRETVGIFQAELACRCLVTIG